MHRVMSESLQTGMILAEAVRGPRGDVLLPAGIELTERHLRGLRTWGVASVMVQGEQQGPAAPGAAVDLSPEVLEAARAKIAPRFARCGTEHPLLAFLAEEAALRVAQRAPAAEPHA